MSSIGIPIEKWVRLAVIVAVASIVLVGGLRLAATIPSDFERTQADHAAALGLPADATVQSWP